jgi:anaerobic magnesium-protoporphyrin IX monomethyl ester cyclase
VGAESGSQKVLDAMDKGTRVEQIVDAARGLRAAGIKVGFFLQFGYPGETRADIAKTFQLVREAAPDDIGMSVSYPLPGTKFYGAVQAQLGAQQNWVDSSDLAMMYRGPFPTAFYRKLHVVLHKEFRLRNGLAVLRRGEIRPALMAKSLYHALTLPLARLELEVLARLPHRGVAPLAPFMDAAAAGIPTPREAPLRAPRTRGTPVSVEGRSGASPTGPRHRSGRPEAP